MPTPPAASPRIMCCEHARVIYTPDSVTAKRKYLQYLQLVALAHLLLCAAGCSGVRASHTVSPVDFLIPGGGGMLRRLLYAPPAAPPPLPDSTVPLAPATETPTQVASLR